MKKVRVNVFAVLSFLILSLILVSSGAQAAMGEQCNIDLASQVPAEQNWDDVYQIRDEFGNLWQRAIIGSVADGTIRVREGESTDIVVTGQPHSPMQVFFFAADNDRPDRAVCVDAGDGNGNGIVVFPVHARFLWSLINEEIVIDAWTMLESSWSHKAEAESDQHFYIGTHMPAPKVNVELESLPVSCERRLCDQSPYFSAVNILPNSFRDVARGAFPFSGDEPNNNLAPEIIIAKLSPTTFYSMVNRQDSAPEAQEGSERFIDRALVAEILKRIVLDSLDPADDDSSQGLSTEVFAEIIESNEDTAAKRLLESSRDALSYSDTHSLRVSALTDIHAMVLKIFPEDTSAYAVPDIALISEIFPAAETDPEADVVIDDSWMRTLLRIFRLWTGEVEENICLLESDFGAAANFLNVPVSVANAPAPEINCNERQMSSLPQWQASPPRGRDPLLVLPKSEQGTDLSPHFSQASISRSDILFNTQKNAWSFSKGDVPRLAYEYKLIGDDFAARPVASACIAVNNVTDYAHYLQQQLHLPESAQKDLSKELYALLLGEDQLTTITLAHPEDVAKRIDWLVDGMNVNIPQAFFARTSDACDSVAFGEVTQEVQDYFQRYNKNGYGIGLY